MAVAASYPPTISDLRVSFLAVHPGYEFGVAVSNIFMGKEHGLLAPKEPIGGKTIMGHLITNGMGPIKFPICHEYGIRCQEWIKYIYDQANVIAIEANIALLPTVGQMSQDPFQPLHLAERMYLELCRNPEITPAKRLAREQGREAKICLERKRKEEHEKQVAAAKEWAVKTGWKSHGEPIVGRPMGSSIGDDDFRVIQAYNIAVRRSTRLSTFAVKTSLTEHEAEAILAYFIHADGISHIHGNPYGFKKDTLLALKIFNRFASEHGIRVEDAITVFREYAL